MMLAISQKSVFSSSFMMFAGFVLACSNQPAVGGRMLDTSYSENTISSHDNLGLDSTDQMMFEQLGVPGFGDMYTWVTGHLNRTQAWFYGTPECKQLAASMTWSSMKEQFITSTRQLWTFLDPAVWFKLQGSVMEVHGEEEDLEEIDMVPSASTSAVTLRCDLQGIGNATCALNLEALLENLKNLPAEVCADIWLRRAKEVGFKPSELAKWLHTMIAMSSVARSEPAMAELAKVLVDKTELHLPKHAKQLLREVVDEVRKEIAEAGTGSAVPKAPSAAKTLDAISVALESESSQGSPKVLAVRSRTSMWDDPYWRGQLVRSMWSHADHIGGYMIRTAIGKIGSEDGAQRVRGQDFARNNKLMAQNKMYNAYSDKEVVAWPELDVNDGELMQKLWNETAPLFRKLDGVDPNAEYVVAFTMRGMRAGGIIDRSGQGLPGPIWHKDVFADHVVINYPFCFLPGYDNELADLDIYKEADPGAQHLAKFTDDLRRTVMVPTVPEGARAGFGETVGFNNNRAVHRARPPMTATRDEVMEAGRAAKDWGVPDGAIRLMIHITIRKKSWTDMAELVAQYFPDVFGTFLGPLVKCFQQIPWLEQWWFNQFGGFIDRKNRQM